MNKYAIEYAIFKPISRFKKCYSCFRCRGEHEFGGGLWVVCKKPDKHTPVKCISACSPDIKGDRYHNACEYWEPRWYWNLKQRYGYLRYCLGRWYCENIRMKIGAMRPAVPLEYVDTYDGMRDRIIRNGEPKCPYCGEMPYSYEQCMFCGQRFTQKIRPKTKGNIDD